MSDQHGADVISTLIARKLAGEMTDSERSDLEKWINESQENKQLYDLIADPGTKRERDNFIKDIDTDADWQKVSVSVFGEKPRQTYLTWYYAAASVALLCVATAAFFLYRSQRPGDDRAAERMVTITAGSSQAVVRLHDGKTIALGDSANENRQFNEANGAGLFNAKGNLSYQAGILAPGELIYNEIFVPRAGEYKLTLSDGTQVWLNSETQLRYPVQFPASERVVHLTGEAYFEVVHDTNRPFIVNTTQRGQVQVHGTSFNINAYADNTHCLVTLNEGKVSVKAGGRAPSMLQPDQQAIISESDGTIGIVNVDASQFSAWKDGLLVFDNLAFYDISKLLSRWYNVQFEFADDHVKAYRFTADIRRYGSFQEVLRFFEKTHQLTFDVAGRTVRVSRWQGEGKK